MSVTDDSNLLGLYLRDRRARIDPSSLGLPVLRRRTPGLRREEVAQRANVSATWYTWLEQGRGGAPSVDVLDRLARALGLTPAEREHLFFLAQRRPPETPFGAGERISPALQTALDALELCPAVVKTGIWDIVGWNRAAACVLTDYGAVPPERRNSLRLLFTDARMRSAYPDWEGNARFVVSLFRADVARAGASKRAAKLVEDLARVSPDFARMWNDTSLRPRPPATKQIRHPTGGTIALDYSALAVEGQPNLTVMIFTPATAADAGRIRAIVDAEPLSVAS